MFSRAGGESAAGAGKNSPPVPPQVAADRKLVDRCLAGDIPAWSELYQAFHDTLLASIRGFLGRAGHDANLVDEIAARVWYAVLKNEFELLSRFDPARGCRLSTFLSLLAKNETRLLLRSERRRKVREQVASKQEVDPSYRSDSPDLLSDEEFVATLTPAERAFYFDVLLPSGSQSPAPEATAEGMPLPADSDKSTYSQQNLWQLRHRIRKKLERFLGDI